MKKLTSGFLLKTILNRFTNKKEMKLSPNRSIWMYFAHSNTIASMLNSLGVFDRVGEELIFYDSFTFLCTISFISLESPNLHLASSLNCIQAHKALMFKSITKSAPKTKWIFLRLIYHIVEQCAHWVRCTKYIMIFYQSKAMMKNV